MGRTQYIMITLNFRENRLWLLRNECNDFVPLIMNLKLKNRTENLFCPILEYIMSCSWYHMYLDNSRCSRNVCQQTECVALKETTSWICQLYFMLASSTVSLDLQNIPLLMIEVTSRQITGWKGEASWELKFIYKQQTTEINRIDYKRQSYLIIE